MGIFVECRGEEREAGEKCFEESGLGVELIGIDLDTRRCGADWQGTWPRLCIARIHDGVVQSGVLWRLTRWKEKRRKKTLYINCKLGILTVPE